jgi:ribosomal subunit interface protein
MGSHVVFTECDDALRARLQAYWEKELPRLQKYLTNYPSDAVDVRLTVHRRPKTPTYALFEVRGVVEMPTGTVVAEWSEDNPEAAIDHVVKKLAEDLRRHKELVRKDYLYKRKSRRRDDLSAAGPLLKQHRDAGERDSFFQVLRPLLDVLRDHARRELRVLEIEGLLHREEITVDDIVDDVVTQAWERFDERPKYLRLDLWLIDLLHDTFEQYIKQEVRPHVSLDEKVDDKVPAEVPQVDDQEWWDWLVEGDEVSTLGDQVADPKTTPVEDKVAGEEQKDRILSMLLGLPAAQRQAFLLHVLEDFTPPEISILQNRPEREVRTDIDAVRKIIQARLRAAESGQESKAVAATK